MLIGLSDDEVNLLKAAYPHLTLEQALIRGFTDQVFTAATLETAGTPCQVISFADAKRNREPS